MSARVRATVADLELLLSQAGEGIRRVSEGATDSITVSGAGAVVHSWYNELEKTFELIARRIDGWTPGGDDWHAQLAGQMVLSAPNVRPAVLPASLAEPLRELRAFRHLFRHLYVLNLDSARVLALLSLLRTQGPNVNAALLGFAAALEALAGALESG